MKKYMIAVDVGGTKTEAILFDENGFIAEFYRGRGVNPLISGKAASEEAYFEILDPLIQHANGNISAVYAGIPALQYFGTQFHKDFEKRYSGVKIVLEPDAVMMISANLGHADGACMVCGTGSGLYIRKNNSIKEYGGWGWLIGGCGSGYLLGLGAIQACAAQQDGTGPETILTELCAKRYGDNILNHLPELYAGGRPLFASFAGELFAAAAAGDKAAAARVDACAADLAELIRSSYRDLGSYSLILNGGIFQNFPSYVELLRKKSPPQVDFVTSKYPPVYGAAVEAMTVAGLSVTDVFKETFLQNYKLKKQKI